MHAHHGLHPMRPAAQLVANEQDGLVYIIDLKSAHGTHIEGEKLVPNKPTALKIGQEVRFGAHDGGARYKVTAAPSRKRPAEDKLGDDKVSKRKIPEGKVSCMVPRAVNLAVPRRKTLLKLGREEVRWGRGVDMGGNVEKSCRDLQCGHLQTPKP
jgi:pSer/pThr/pTyr-binding forkhead associated (FHA) protein